MNLNRFSDISIKYVYEALISTLIALSIITYYVVLWQLVNKTKKSSMRLHL